MLGTYWVYGIIYDCDDSVFNNVNVKLVNLIDNVESDVFTTSVDGKYQINVGEIADFGDIVRIEVTEPTTDSTIYRIIKIDDTSLASNEDFTFSCCPTRTSSMPTFTLKGESYHISLNKPEWDNLESEIRKDLKHFAFWSNNYSVYDIGLNSNALVLGGIDVGNGGFTSKFEEKFKRIHEMMDNNEEITIDTLETDTNGVYVIKNFNYNTDQKPCVFVWYIVLEFVRDV